MRITRNSRSRQPLKDAAVLVFLLLIVLSVRVGGAEMTLEPVLGEVQAAEPPEVLELNAPAAVFPSEDDRAPRVLTLPTTLESPRPECSPPGLKERLSC